MIFYNDVINLKLQDIMTPPSPSPPSAHKQQLSQNRHLPYSPELWARDQVRVGRPVGLCFARSKEGRLKLMG